MYSSAAQEIGTYSIPATNWRRRLSGLSAQVFRTDSQHTQRCAGRAMVSCSIAALGSVLLLRVAHAFVPPGLNTVVVSRPNRRRTAAPREEPRYNQGLSPSPQPDAGGLLSCIDNRGGASPRISVGASSSRGKFLESLLVSSAALVVCTTAADAAGTEAAGSAGDPAPVRRGKETDKSIILQSPTFHIAAPSRLSWIWEEDIW